MSWPLYQVDAFTAEPFTGTRPPGRVPAGQRRGPSWLDFPATPAEPVDPPPGLVEALGAGAPRWVGRARFDSLVELDDEATVRDLAPDTRGMGGLGSRGVIVTAAAAGAGGYDFVSRYVAPAAGIDEDPVTGSAHCTLGPFWAERLGRKELELTGFQASAGGGLVQVRPDGDRVHPGGRAVTVLRASWSDARAGSRQGSRSRPPGAGRPGRPG